MLPSTLSRSRTCWKSPAGDGSSFTNPTSMFRQGDAKGPVIWIIQQGRVELVEERPSGQHVHDVLGEGDLLGLDRFPGDGTCLCSARTTTDAILYGIAAASFESLLPRYPAVSVTSPPMPPSPASVLNGPPGSMPKRRQSISCVPAAPVASRPRIRWPCADIRRHPVPVPPFV